MNRAHDVTLTASELAELPEYSCSLPTGTTIGKRWRRNRAAYARGTVVGLHPFDGTPIVEYPDEEWWLGEYVDIGEPERVGIVWRRVRVAAEETPIRSRAHATGE